MTATIKSQRMGKRRWLRELGWRHVVGVGALFFALFPVWFVVLAAFSNSAALSNQPLWPELFTLRQYRKLVDEYPFWNWFFNSLLVSAVTAAATVLLAAAAAFAFSRLRFRGRRAGLLSLLLVQMFPASLAFVAIYLMVQQRLPNAFPSLGPGSMATIVLFYLGGALGSNAWLIKGFFDTIPKELDDSAKIDGASHAQIFWRIIMPLGAPVLAIIFLLSFISSQAEFLVASVVLFGQDKADPSKTVAVGLQGLLAGDRYDLNWGPFAVGALLASVPVVLLFQFLQRFIVGGITAGAVKG